MKSKLLFIVFSLSISVIFFRPYAYTFDNVLKNMAKNKDCYVANDTHGDCGVGCKDCYKVQKGMTKTLDEVVVYSNETSETIKYKFKVYMRG